MEEGEDEDDDGIQEISSKHLWRAIRKFGPTVWGIPPMHIIGALSLNTANIKLQLRNESRQWKVQYSDKVHQQARTKLYSLMEYIRKTTNAMSAPVENLHNLR